MFCAAVCVLTFEAAVCVLSLKIKCHVVYFVYCLLRFIVLYCSLCMDFEDLVFCTEVCVLTLKAAVCGLSLKI